MLTRRTSLLARVLVGCILTRLGGSLRRVLCLTTDVHNMVVEEYALVVAVLS